METLSSPWRQECASKRLRGLGLPSHSTRFLLAATLVNMVADFCPFKVPFQVTCLQPPRHLPGPSTLPVSQLLQSFAQLHVK